MDGGWALILSAVVTAVGGIIVAVIAQFRKENKRDHDVVTGLLKILYNKVNKLDGKVDEHIDWHRKVDSSK
jgi:hypothetical protein